MLNFQLHVILYSLIVDTAGIDLSKESEIRDKISLQNLKLGTDLRKIPEIRDRSEENI